MNGFELYQKMREIDSNVKICFLTASELFYEEYRRLDVYPRVNKNLYPKANQNRRADKSAK